VVRAIIAGALLASGAVFGAGTGRGTAEYVGTQSCRECHENFYKLWAPSHHGTAMQPFSMARSNLTPHTASIPVGKAAYRADIAAGVVVETAGGAEKRYPIVQALGGKNVSYFLTPLDRGRLQVLPVAFDHQRKEWFDTAGSAVRHFPSHPDEPIHWTEPAYTFNTSCFNCHVSQLTNNYDPATGTYETTWREPGINCETCHGPAGEHVKAARALPKGQPMKDLKLLSFRSFSNDQVNSACGNCHAKMYPLSTSFTPGDQFYDHYGLVTLEHPDFYADGRDLGENFTYTSWRLSPCLKSGTLNCVTCHTSSGRYRFKGELANNACMPCHDQQVKDAAGHSHHKAGTEGAQCVSCHMPKTEFARMVRSDHSMRPPMPAATLAFGSPNACNLCHTNKDARWADKEVRDWRKRDYQAETLKLGLWNDSLRKRNWSAAGEVLTYLASPGRQEVWAASFIQLLRPYDHPRKTETLKSCLKDTSPLVRVAAVEALSDRLEPNSVPLLTAATRDTSRLVRLRAASALAPVPPTSVPEPDRKAVETATAELLSSFLARPDDPAAYQRMGNFYLERRQIDRAITAFETSSKLQPRDVSPFVNVSLAHSIAGDNARAEAALRQALKLEPTNAVANLNLGMLLAELDRLPEAEAAFRIACKSDPQSAQAAFNLGVLVSRDRPEEALNWCRKAADLRPQEARYVYTLAFYQNQFGKTADAIKTLEKLLDTTPAQGDAYGLLAQIYFQRKETEKAADVCRRASANQKLSSQERSEFQARLRALTGAGP
jgi:tetratricopeptide (TPR) repeat protein